ncbi:glycosyltransferase family protein [Chachezhania sediminis]|uniref:glycosyltransferase family protein n=1 Tax=Chachezhania sediminis TaxID=2599291 RepID=UPI00131C6A1B|nr:glycosyltransferase [Chachezhania sediminis]
MKVMIVVTHLLGTGHLSRALTLGRAFAAAGHDVVLATGGRPAPQLDATGVTVVQLPPLASDGTAFTTLLDADGAIADDAYLAARRQALLDVLEDTGPDALITELFPFGRRVLSAEFLALLDAAKGMQPRPRIYCSIRDILAPPSKPARAERAEEIVADHFDAVLVHSDPAATRLEASWPVTARLSGKLRYTGYVAPPPAGAHPQGVGAGEILVSAGGGAVGDSLYAAALGAAGLVPAPMRMLVGGGTQRLAEWQDRAGSAAKVEGPRPDFRQMLQGAAALVSMCGYNTTLDVLQAGAPAAFVPFDDGGEVEQTLRAESLARLPAIRVVPAAGLTPALLAEAVARVMAEGRRTASGLRFDGAAETVRIVTETAA